MTFLSAATIKSCVRTLNQKMDVSTEPAYVFAQLAGACLAAGVFRLRYGLAGDLGVSWPRTDTATAVVVEVAVSAFLMLVIL